MKAKVKATGEIIEVEVGQWWGWDKHYISSTKEGERKWYPDDIEIIESKEFVIYGYATKDEYEDKGFTIRIGGKPTYFNKNPKKNEWEDKWSNTLPSFPYGLDVIPNLLPKGCCKVKITITPIEE